MKNMKIVSVFLSMTLGMTSFAAIPVTAAAAETESTITTVENEDIYFSYPDSEKGYCTCQIGEKTELNLENYDIDNNDYEFGVSPIYFRIKDKSIARIDHVQGSNVSITGVSVGETVLKASTPDDQSISLKIVVEESTVTTSKATESTTPITTTTINRITDTQKIHDILAAYIEENNVNASFADESKYPEFEGAVVIEFFDNSDKLNQLRDFAYLESNLSANYLKIIPVVNGVAITTRPNNQTEITTTTTMSVEDNEIYFSYPDSEKGYCTCQIGEKTEFNLENYNIDNNDYEFGVSLIYFRIEDNSIAKIEHIQGSNVSIIGVSVGETVLKASTPDDQSISVKIVVEESTVTTSTITESTTPITTTTINKITDTQKIYDILAAYIEENNVNASFADESKYPEFEGAVVIEFFDNSDKLNQLRDFAYLESNLSANYLQIIPVVNDVAITTRPTDPIEMTTTTTTTIITEEIVSTSKAIANVEITEVTDNTLFVKPVGDSAKLLRISDKYTLSVQKFKKDNIDIEPVVGMKLEITYNGTIATSYPASFSGVQKIAVISDDIKIVIGDANCDGELSMADAVLIMQSLANPDKYGENGTAETHITEHGRKNADIAGENDGITNADALAIQKKLLKLE